MKTIINFFKNYHFELCISINIISLIVTGICMFLVIWNLLGCAAGEGVGDGIHAWKPMVWFAVIFMATLIHPLVFKMWKETLSK